MISILIDIVVAAIVIWLLIKIVLPRLVDKDRRDFWK